MEIQCKREEKNTGSSFRACLAIYVRLALASCLYKQVRYREHGQKFLASLGRRCIFLHFSASSCSSSSSQLNRSNKSVFLLQSCFTERVNGCVDDAFFVQLSKATLVEDTPFCTTQSLNQHFPWAVADERQTERFYRPVDL